MEKTTEIYNNLSKKECIDKIIEIVENNKDVYIIKVIDKRIHKTIIEIRKNYGNNKYKCTHTA